MTHERPAEWPKSGWYWLLHHGGPLIEWTDDIDERWEYILREKAPEEVDTRLANIAPVRGEGPAELARARIELVKARAELVKADAEWDKACAEWDKACADHLPTLEAFHRTECPDSTWDGKTIFPGKGKT